MVLFRMGQAYGVIRVKNQLFCEEIGVGCRLTPQQMRLHDRLIWQVHQPKHPVMCVMHGAGKDLGFVCYFRWCCIRYSLSNVQYFLRRLLARWLSDQHGLGSPSITILLAPTAYFAHFRASNGENNVQSCDAWC